MLSYLANRLQDYYRFYGEDAAIDAFGYASTSLRLINPISYTNAISDRNTNADCRVNKRTGLAYYYSGYSNLSLYGNATCSKTENDNTNFSGSLNLSGINLNLFTSDYSASMLNLQSYTRAYVSATCDRDSGQYCYASNRVTLNGTATVTYEYKAVAVPEPSILALMGLGIFALGLSRRNIKK